MKLATILFASFFIETARAELTPIHFQNTIVLEKTYLHKSVLLKDLLKLHRDFNYEEVRMIAEKKTSWSDKLRERLKGSSGTFRF